MPLRSDEIKSLSDEIKPLFDETRWRKALGIAKIGIFADVELQTKNRPLRSGVRKGRFFVCLVRFSL
jgi:hypothetical protein